MSGLEIVGALASASQLAGLCSRVLKSFSDLYHDIKTLPDDIQDCLAQVDQLVKVAELVSNTPALHSPVVAETIREALADTERLLNIVERVPQSRKSHFLKQQWHNIQQVVQEPRVRKLLDKLGGSKATLSLCIDALNNQALQSIGLEVKHIRDGSNQITEVWDDVRNNLTNIEISPKIESHLRTLTVEQQSLREKVKDIHSLMPDLKKLGNMIDSVATFAVCFYDAFAACSANKQLDFCYPDKSFTARSRNQQSDGVKTKDVHTRCSKPPFYRPRRYHHSN